MKVFILLLVLSSCSSKSWKDASRQSANIAPKASELKEDIVLIYYARAYSWRGTFGVHPWISWKKTGDKYYTVAEVTSWNLRIKGNSSVSIKKDIPDRLWFGSRPSLLFEARGKKATSIIKQVQNLLPTYPHQDSYRVWPGPNSNTFIAWLIRNIDELNIELPSHAVGKDYFEKGQFFAKTASSTGFQFSLFGLFGLTLGLGEGIEANILGLSFGIDFWTPALKLPMVGRFGFSDYPIN